MRNFSLTILLVFYCAFANAQQPVSKHIGSMDVCGKEIELGVLPKIVFDKLDGSGCVFYNTTNDPDMFLIVKGKIIFGSVKFTNGLLTHITREWASDVKTPEEFAREIVNALQEVQTHGSSQCVLSTLNQLNPSDETRGSVMKCGQRTLVIMVSIGSDMKKFQIQEILGE
jgi:hypothetical protein